MISRSLVFEALGGKKPHHCELDLQYVFYSMPPIKSMLLFILTVGLGL